MKPDERGAGTPVELAGLGKGRHNWQASEECMNPSSEIADAFAVDDSHFKDALLPTGVEVSGHQILKVGRTESVEVKLPINRQ